MKLGNRKWSTVDRAIRRKLRFEGIALPELLALYRRIDQKFGRERPADVATLKRYISNLR